MKKLFAGIITCTTILLTGIGVSAVAADENNSGNENVQSEIVFCIVNSEQTGRTAYSYGGFFIESNGNVRTFSFDNIEENFTFNAYWDAFYNAPQSVMLNESFPHDKLLSHLNDNISEYKIVENISTEEYASKASLLSEIKVDAEIPFVPFEIAGMTSYTESFGVRYDNDDNAQIVFMNGHVSGDMKYRTYLENPDEKSIELNNWLIEKYKSFISSEPITTTAPTTPVTSTTTTVTTTEVKPNTEQETEPITEVPKIEFCQVQFMENVFYYANNEEYITITGSNLKKVENIPDEIENLPVKELATRAFFACTNSALSITIPENVEVINNECFLGVIGSGYTTYFLPSSIQSIGKYALGYTCYEDYQEGCVIGNKIDKLRGVMIYGYLDTAAEIYANENGFTFIALDDAPNIPTTTDATTTTTETTTTDSTETTTETTITSDEESTATTIKSEITSTTTTVGTSSSLSDTTSETNSTTITTTTIVGTTDETETTDSIENIAATTETTTTATTHIASDAELCDWAVKDYEEKTGVTPANAEIEYTADDTAIITLIDAEGNVLDVYTIDPTTGTGTESDGGEVNLPQTGYSNWYHTAATLAACVTVIGGVIVIGSGVLKRKR